MKKWKNQPRRKVDIGSDPVLAYFEDSGIFKTFTGIM